MTVPLVLQDLIRSLYKPGTRHLSVDVQIDLGREFLHLLQLPLVGIR